MLLIDLDQEIPSSSVFFYDAVHLNNNGSELVSTIIAGKLKSLVSEFYSE